MSKKITQIEPQKKRKRRFNIYVDGEFSFGLSEDTIINQGIRIGQELDEKIIEKLLEEDQGIKAFDKALRFLDYRPRSEKEIRDKLKEKEFDSKLIDLTIKKLYFYKYLNDEEFAKMWVKDRRATKPEGKFLIRRELRDKGISNELIEKVLSKELSEKDEAEDCLRLAQKADKKYYVLPSFERKQKITAYLARRGYSFDIINKVLNKI